MSLEFWQQTKKDAINDGIHYGYKTKQAWRHIISGLFHKVKALTLYISCPNQLLQLSRKAVYAFNHSKFQTTKEYISAVLGIEIWYLYQEQFQLTSSFNGSVLSGVAWSLPIACCRHTNTHKYMHEIGSLVVNIGKWFHPTFFAFVKY